VCDAQSGHEKTLTGLLAALAGANLIYGLGMLESGVTMDFAQLVLDDEIAGLIKHTVAGFAVNDETIMVEDIDQVGSSGDFLALESTLRNMRAFSQPRLLDRRIRLEWEADGATTVSERAAARAREILETHVPEPLADGVGERLDAIIADAAAELGLPPGRTTVP
jgi:trimethylamine---corrinoid protein Co-methyltransferase